MRMFIRSLFVWLVSPVMLLVLAATSLPMLFASADNYKWEKNWWLEYHHSYLTALRFKA